MVFLSFLATLMKRPVSSGLSPSSSSSIWCSSLGELGSIGAPYVSSEISSSFNGYSSVSLSSDTIFYRACFFLASSRAFTFSYSMRIFLSWWKFDYLSNCSPILLTIAGFLLISEPEVNPDVVLFLSVLPPSFWCFESWLILGRDSLRDSVDDRLLSALLEVLLFFSEIRSLFVFRIKRSSCNKLRVVPG